nr:methyl-accepting chemotaxis protein [Brevibacillus sp. SYP-B805]
MLQFKTINRRTMFFVLPVIILGIAIAMGFIFFRSYQLSQTLINEKMENQLDATVHEIETKLTAHSRIAVTLARSVESVGHTLNKDDFAALLKNAVSQNRETFGAGIFYEPFKYKGDLKYFGPYVYKDYSKNGEITYTDDLSTPEYDYPHWDWYKIAINTSQPVVWSDPYFDENTNVAMVTSTAPFYDGQKKFLGVATGDIDLTSLQKMVSELKVGRTGYAFLLDQNGTYLAARESEKLMKVKITEEQNQAVASLGKEIMSKENGATSFKEGRDVYHVYYKTVPGTGWKLAFVLNETEVYQPINEMTWAVAPVMVIAILLVVLSILYNSRYINRNIRQVNEVVSAMAQGDFSCTIPVNGTDEFAQMGSQLNKMGEQLRSIIEKVSLHSQQVAATSEQLAAIVEENSKATEQITHAVQTIAVGADEQMSISDRAVQVVAEITNGMDQIASRTQMVAETAQKASDIANNGNEVVEGSIHQMNFIDQKVKACSEAINILHAKSQEINQITSLITSIAAQTNLLALNAAIESARAGEYGKGFAVVADEVRKLAEQSGEAASQINELISDIQQEIEKAVASMNDGAVAVHKGILMVDNAGSSFREILTAVFAVSEQSREVSSAVEQIHASTATMMSLSQQLAHISKEAAVNTQHAAASTEEQNATMEEISSSAQNLANMANELQDALQIFKW